MKYVKVGAFTLSILVMMIFSASCKAQSGTARLGNGNHFFSLCSGNQNTLCTSYVHGVIDGLVSIGAMCVPTSVLDQQFVDSVIAFLRDQPEQRSVFVPYTIQKVMIKNYESDCEPGDQKDAEQIRDLIVEGLKRLPPHN